LTISFDIQLFYLSFCSSLNTSQNETPSILLCLSEWIHYYFYRNKAIKLVLYAHLYITKDSPYSEFNTIFALLTCLSMTVSHIQASTTSF